MSVSPAASNLVLNDPPLLKSGDRARAAFRPPPAATSSTTTSSATPSLKSGETEKTKKPTKRKRDSITIKPETSSSPAAATGSEAQHTSTHKSKKGKKQQDRQVTTPSPSSTPTVSAASSRHSSSPVSASTALLHQFQPAPLSDAASNVLSSSSSPVLWLFQFPVNFDVNEFTQQVQLQIPQHSGTEDQSIFMHFTMQGKRYSIIECHKRHAAGLINLFPSNESEANNDGDDEDMRVNQSGQTSRLSPGTPFTRVFHIVQNASAAYHSYTGSEAAITRTIHISETQQQQGLQINFRPIGYIKDQQEHMKNGRRGRAFQPVHYDTAAVVQHGINNGNTEVVTDMSKEHKKHHKHKHKHHTADSNNHTSESILVKKEKKSKKETLEKEKKHKNKHHR